MYKKTIMVILFVILFSMNPASSAFGENGNQSGYDLPTYAKKYYNSQGELIGAVANDPSQIKDCLPVKQEDSQDLLHHIELKRSGSDIIVQIIDKTGVLVESKIIPFDELVSQAGSTEKANELIKQVPDIKPGSELDPIEQPYLIPPVYWVLKYSEEITHEWTNVGELYAGPMMNVHLSLKMSSGTYSTTSVTGGGFTVGGESTYAKTWITDLYAYNWQTFTIRMMNDYKYEYWEAWTIVPWFIVASQQIWKCTGIRGGTIELCSPNPDAHRSKTTSDDSVSLNPGETKRLTYGQLSNRNFKFDVGVKLKRPWTAPLGTVTEFEVPLISISHISGYYTDTEAVYYLTSTANYYHIWDIYEFGCNYGTAGGYVPTFSLYY